MTTTTTSRKGAKKTTIDLDSELEQHRQAIAAAETELAEAEAASNEATSQFEADPTDAGATSRLVARQRADNARKRLSQARANAQPAFTREQERKAAQAAKAADVTQARKAIDIALDSFGRDLDAAVSSVVAAITSLRAHNERARVATRLGATVVHLNEDQIEKMIGERIARQFDLDQFSWPQPGSNATILFARLAEKRVAR